MQLSNSQQRMLADMGIEAWALRRSEPLVREESQTMPSVEPATAAISVGRQHVLLLVMENTRLSETAQRLLNAMLKAVSLDTEQVMVLSAEDFRQIDTTSLANKAVLLMGKAVIAQVAPELTPEQSETLDRYQALVSTCFSLDEMLQQPPCKAAAWQALQQLRTVF